MWVGYQGHLCLRWMLKVSANNFQQLEHLYSHARAVFVLVTGI
jgi:hypothetical protein